MLQTVEREAAQDISNKCLECSAQVNGADGVIERLGQLSKELDAERSARCLTISRVNKQLAQEIADSRASLQDA